MSEKERYYRFSLNKKIKNIFIIFSLFLLITNTSHYTLKEKITENFSKIKTLSFDFKQKISEKEEIGKCFIKYPLLMRCNYDNLKKKILISNGKSVAIIKKKYKKIYYYPLKTTPLFIILDKQKLLNLMTNEKEIKINSDIIQFTFIDEKNNKLRIFFDKNSLDFKGWRTTDAYSNDVSFIIENLKINQEINNNLFKIPREKDL